MLQSPAAVVVALLAANAAAGFVMWFRSMRLARGSEDIPTSRIRSAAQGYVEVFGMTRPLESGPLRAPLTGRPCVWWSYRVTFVGGNQPLKIQEDTSRQPFFVEDATGRCLVDPAGADLRPSHEEAWTSSKSSSYEDRNCQDPTSTMYQCSESLLAPGKRLYVLGEFRTVRRSPQALDRMREKLHEWLGDDKHRAVLDVNRDGTLDEREMEAARRCWTRGAKSAPTWPTPT